MLGLFQVLGLRHQKIVDPERTPRMTRNSYHLVGEKPCQHANKHSWTCFAVLSTGWNPGIDDGQMTYFSVIKTSNNFSPFGSVWPFFLKWPVECWSLPSDHSVLTIHTLLFYSMFHMLLAWMKGPDLLLFLLHSSGCLWHLVGATCVFLDYSNLEISHCHPNRWLIYGMEYSFGVIAIHFDLFQVVFDYFTWETCCSDWPKHEAVINFAVNWMVVDPTIRQKLSLEDNQKINWSTTNQVHPSSNKPRAWKPRPCNTIPPSCSRPLLVFCSSILGEVIVIPHWKEHVATWRSSILKTT